MIPLLLTATVDPQGMQGASFPVGERVQQYVEAIGFYRGLGLSVVLAENSGRIDTLCCHFDGDDGIEWIDASKAPYDKNRGKGYNETLLIHEALGRSALIGEAGCFFKLTGRLRVLNIGRLLAECERRERNLAARGALLRLQADCKDHSVYEWLRMPINGHVGECRYWFARTDFFEQRMWPLHDRLNDYGDAPWLAEDAMLEVCRQTRGEVGCRDRFRTQARISGRGGHTLGQGLSFFYSTDNDSLALRLKCGLRQLIRWILPFWKA